MPAHAPVPPLHLRHAGRAGQPGRPGPAPPRAALTRTLARACALQRNSEIGGTLALTNTASPSGMTSSGQPAAADYFSSRHLVRACLVRVVCVRMCVWPCVQP